MVSAPPIEVDKVWSVTPAPLYGRLQPLLAGCSPVCVMNKILPALLTVMRRHSLHLSTDRMGGQSPRVVLHASITLRPYSVF